MHWEDVNNHTMTGDAAILAATPGKKRSVLQIQPNLIPATEFAGLAIEQPNRPQAQLAAANTCGERELIVDYWPLTFS